MERERIVLTNAVVEDDLTRVADTYDWWLRRRIARNGDQPAEYIYSTDDKATDLHFIPDHKIGVTYILVQGAAVAEVVEALKANLFHFGADSIRRNARNELSPEDRLTSLYHLALITMDKGFDQEVFEIYSTAMRHPDMMVRGAAMLGSAYLGWPELAVHIRKLANDDEDESIRRDASLLAGRLEALAADQV